MFEEKKIYFQVTLSIYLLDFLFNNYRAYLQSKHDCIVKNPPVENTKSKMAAG